MQLLKRIQTAVTEQMPVDGLQSGTTTSVQTTLYTCKQCGTTYIASDMQECPDCDESLDEVPSGSELGYTSAES